MQDRICEIDLRKEEYLAKFPDLEGLLDVGKTILGKAVGIW